MDCQAQAATSRTPNQSPGARRRAGGLSQWEQVRALRGACLVAGNLIKQLNIADATRGLVL